MSIQYKETWFLQPRDIYPYITIYDNEDVVEIVAKLLTTEKLATSIGNFEFLPLFRNLNKVVILCGEASEEGMSKLYRHKNIETLCFETSYFSSPTDKDGIINLNEFPNIRALVTHTIDNVVNLTASRKLQTLSVLQLKCNDLSFLSNLCQLDSLSIGKGCLRSLLGIENTKIQCLYISYQRFLQDINVLEECVLTLKALRISQCPKILDFSVISKLEKLEFLSICGTNGFIDNLEFIDNLPNLSYFVTNYNIRDGNIKPLLKLPHSSILINHKHYNLNDNDLNRKNTKTGDGDIPEWRKLKQ